MSKFHRRYFRGADCGLLPEEEPVQSGLAYTPSDMFDLAKDRLPISAQTHALDVDYGTRNVDFVPPLETMRHADFADIWEQSMDAKKRLKKAVQEAPRKEVQS